MMKTQKFPLRVQEMGVSATIRRVSQHKAGKKYTSFVAEYCWLGKRRQVWRSKFEDARNEALKGCRAIAKGEQESLTLTQANRLEYLRATQTTATLGVSLDTATHEYAHASKLLGGRASIVEACREWIGRNAVEFPKITAADAIQKLLHQAAADGKSAQRQKQLAAILNRFGAAFSVEEQAIKPSLISAYLTALPFKERTKRNHRDTIGFFNRWLILCGYLAKDTNWLEGVQNYTARKQGEIGIYAPDELQKLLAHADGRLVPFLAIGAFAGLRHAEIARLDWSEVEVSEADGENFIEVRADKAKTQTRRLVPVKANLKAWLLPHKKLDGRVCCFKNITKQLLRLAPAAGVEWKHNGLRHSAISYRIAECGDVPRVSDESGNSVQVIRTNYLRRVKPAAAAEWFAIVPPTATAEKGGVQ